MTALLEHGSTMAVDLYRRERRAPVVVELGGFLRQNHGGEILVAAQGVTRLMKATGAEPAAAKSGGVTTQQFFELPVSYRNRLAHGVRPGCTTARSSPICYSPPSASSSAR